MYTLGEIGEHAAIRRIVPLLQGHQDLIVGAGDDCAVCRLPGTGCDQVFTTDPIIEGVHFLAGEKPERVGNKAAGRVLSDIAAMGASAQWLLVNVVAPPELEMEYLERVYAGMTALCSQFGAVIIGGDVAKGSSFELHLFGTGLLPSDTAVLRSGAQVGDSIYVTGPLGNSRAGKHLDFIPRIAEGIFLRESGWVTAMMDVSDGLATDLRHLLKQSGVGASLQSESIPRNASVDQALFDGEDFELVFTADPRIEACWLEQYGTAISPIGVVQSASGILTLDGEEFTRKAFEHFAKE